MAEKKCIREEALKKIPKQFPVGTGLEELKEKLVEYKALPDDLTARLIWQDANPPPKIPLRCRECGKIYGYFQLTWTDIEFELNKGRNPLREIGGLCPKCAGPEEEEE